MHLWEIKDKAGMGGGGGEGGGMVPLRNPIDSTLFTSTQSEHRLHLKHLLQSNEAAHLSPSDMKEITHGSEGRGLRRGGVGGGSSNDPLVAFVCIRTVRTGHVSD